MTEIKNYNAETKELIIQESKEIIKIYKLCKI